MADIKVRVQYRRQYERQADTRHFVDLTIDGEGASVVLRARARAQFWPDVAAKEAGDVTAVLVEKVMMPGEYQDE